MFDPFRRKEHINFIYEPGKFVETTLGQMNFFKWVIENNILDFVSKHAAEIEQHMVSSKGCL